MLKVWLNDFALNPINYAGKHPLSIQVAFNLICKRPDRHMNIRVTAMATQLTHNHYTTTSHPKWLPHNDFTKNRSKWLRLWFTGIPNDWPEQWQRGLLDLTIVDQMLAIQLLQTKHFRSSFRASVRKQLEQWLKTPAPDRKYPSPFSEKQRHRLVDNRFKRRAATLKSIVAQQINHALLC